jgi:tRNA(Ile)-lysidine synthase
MNLLQRFQAYNLKNNLFRQKDKLLLAVSGGVDSVVLCELCKQSGYDFVIAHCNFQLRGEESERDKKFVKELAKKYGVEFLVKDFDTEKYAGENKLSIQEAARNLRYNWFHELLTTHDSRLTATLTAHHADDNIETLLMNFCRGTGLPGLTGMPEISIYVNVRRPLLDFWKEELIEFAKQNELNFVEDSSNLSSKYTRNLFRNEIIPLISKVYPQVKENLQDNIERFKDIRKLYSISVAELKKKLCKIKGKEIHIPIKQLFSYHSRALIFEIILEYGFTEKQLDDVIKLSESESGKFVQSPNSPARIIKFRNWFIISTAASLSAQTIVIEEEIRNLELGIGNLVIEILLNSPSDPAIGAGKLQIPDATNIACLDADEISFPLILRKWKQGDYFYPLGMKKKKKLARFFIDQKFSKTDKEKIWVLEMNKKIIWVVGHRIDERFKITEKTKEILKITFTNSQTV